MSQDPENANAELGYKAGTLRNFISAMKDELGQDTELLKQAFSDLNAIQRQDARNHFEGRVEFTRQIISQQGIALIGIREYGLQTLKWLFLLNAGAIAIVLTFVSGLGKSGANPNVPLYIAALWPFAIGCLAVVLAGAAGFFNFSYAEGSMPSAESLNNFLNPKIRQWPIAKMQGLNEASEAFGKRYIWKITFSRNAAITFALVSAVCFIYGSYRLLAAASVYQN